VSFIPQIVVFASFAPPDPSLVATGQAEFNLTSTLRDTVNGRVIEAKTVLAQLDQNGNLAQLLEPNTFTGAEPPNTQYFVTLTLDGSPLNETYLTVPSAPPGSRLIGDGFVTGGSPTLQSATASFTSNDVGLYVWGAGLPPYTTILAVVDSSHATLSTNANANAGPASVLIGAQVSLLSSLGG